MIYEISSSEKTFEKIILLEYSIGVQEDFESIEENLLIWQ